MSKQRVLLCKVGSMIALLALLITFTFISDVRVTHAASRVSQSTLQPYCSGYMWKSPFSQNVRRFTEADIVAYWACEGSFHVVANINWGDGQSDSYTCWANCGSGSTLFSHTYIEWGTYDVTLWMNGSASGSAFATVHVD